jgi:hypothetical protein
MKYNSVTPSSTINLRQFMLSGFLDELSVDMTFAQFVKWFEQ